MWGVEAGCDTGAGGLAAILDDRLQVGGAELKDERDRTIVAVHLHKLDHIRVAYLLGRDHTGFRWDGMRPKTW